MTLKNLRNARQIIITLIAVTAGGLHGCKSTGNRNRSGIMEAKTYPASQMQFPTLTELSAARSRAIEAVSHAGGKDPVLVYINMYPAENEPCKKNTTIEFGISYDTGNKDDQARAAGFYLKPNPKNQCTATDELVMDASRALNAFLGMRPIDESGPLKSSIQIEPSEFMKKSATTLKLEDSKAWNLFIKTMLGPITLDSVQYQMDMLCTDDSIASALFMAADGSRIKTGDEEETGPLCPPKASGGK